MLRRAAKRTAPMHMRGPRCRPRRSSVHEHVHQSTRLGQAQSLRRPSVCRSQRFSAVSTLWRHRQPQPALLRFRRSTPAAIILHHIVYPLDRPGFFSVPLDQFHRFPSQMCSARKRRTLLPSANNPPCRWRSRMRCSAAAGCPSALLAGSTRTLLRRTPDLYPARSPRRPSIPFRNFQMASRNASLIRTLIAKPMHPCGPSSRSSLHSQRNNSFS